VYAGITCYGIADSNRLAIAQSVYRIERAGQLMRTLPRLEDSLTTMQEIVAGLANKVLIARSEADALAELFRRVSAVAGASGLQAEGLLAETDTMRVGRARRVSMLGSFTGAGRSLVALLDALASDSALAAVRLDVTASDPWAGGDAGDRLGIQVLVSAWYVEAAVP
jgi:hypothetical protein